MGTTTAITIKTRDIKESLQEYAQKNNLKVQECDFTLNGVSTYMSTLSQKDFTLISKELIKEYLDKKRILNEHISFHQIYNITLMKKPKRDLSLSYRIKMDKFATHPTIIISETSKIPTAKYSVNECLQLIYKELNKIKASHQILINIFDSTMKEKLKLFIKHVYSQKFTKKVQLSLFEGIEPQITRSAKLSYLYKMKEEASQVIEVEADEVLIRYQKPIFGKNGFDSFGQIIDTYTSNNESDITIEMDASSIKIEEDDNQKLYKSKIKGFVNLVNNLLTIDNKIQLEKISRNNKSVASEEQNNIEVHISQNDTNKDSIGEGVELVSESIHVSGHVGANSLLEANTLKIDGATHQDSTQLAHTAEINRHKGMLRCHRAKVLLLEGGIIDATHVEIESCLGGTIHAQDVTIGHVKHNLKVYASNSITIRLVSGEDNVFKINYRDIPILQSKIKYIKNDIEDLKYHLEEAKRHTKDRIPELTKKIKEFQEEEDLILHSYEKATIHIQNAFRGLNKIVFTIDETNEIEFKTDKTEYSAFHLEINEESVTLQPVDISLPLEK